MLREDNWCAVEIHFGFGISHRAAAMLTVTTVTSATSTLLQHGHINYITFTLYNCIVQMEFLPREIRVAFRGESQLRQSRATQPTMHAGCSGVSIIHRTLTWTTGSFTCSQMLMYAIAHEGCTDTVRESALKVDSGRKIPCHTGESNLRQRRAGRMLYQLSYIPHTSTLYKPSSSSFLLSSVPVLNRPRNGDTCDAG